VERVFIGLDPQKLSVTIEVVDHVELVLGSGRFSTDRVRRAAGHPARMARATVLKK